MKIHLLWNDPGPPLAGTFTVETACRRMIPKADFSLPIVNLKTWEGIAFTARCPDCTLNETRTRQNFPQETMIEKRLSYLESMIVTVPTSSDPLGQHVPLLEGVEGALDRLGDLVQNARLKIAELEDKSESLDRRLTQGFAVRPIRPKRKWRK